MPSHEVPSCLFSLAESIPMACTSVSMARPTAGWQSSTTTRDTSAQVSTTTSQHCGTGTADERTLSSSIFPSDFVRSPRRNDPATLLPGTDSAPRASGVSSRSQSGMPSTRKTTRTERPSRRSARRTASGYRPGTSPTSSHRSIRSCARPHPTPSGRSGRHTRRSVSGR